MPVILQTIQRPNWFEYSPEYNPDGTEKHINQDGARFHVLNWDTRGTHCSEPNCEINKRAISA